MNSKKYCILAFALLNCLLALCEDSAERTMRDFQRLGLRQYEATDVRILPTGEIKFRDLFQEVEQAEKYILLDYFKFQQDSICGELLKILKRKVQQGVEVRIIFDSFGNKSSDLPLSDTLQTQIRQSGIQIAAFDPMRFPWINHLMHRNHHKIAIIDGKTVYTGGMNVADYYLHGKPKVGRWRDMHIRMSGPIVEPYEELFWKMWGASPPAPLQRGVLCSGPTLLWRGRGRFSPLLGEGQGVRLSSLPAGPRSRRTSCGRPTAPASTMPTASCR